VNHLKRTAQLIFCYLLSSVAFAVDGVIEINQACAVNGGCLPGDTAGFPVNIFNNAGSTSYRLTSDLHIEDANTTGISTIQPRITLDLNGFTIQGPVVCNGFATEVDCNPSGTGDGIKGGRFMTVKNGSVTGFGGNGIHLSSGRVMNINAYGNNQIGISVGFSTGDIPFGSLVSDCVANGNNLGILMGFGLVTNSVARGNRTNGFKIVFGGSLQGSSAIGNGGDGINVGIGTNESETTVERVSNNTSTNNGGVGIIGGNGVHISNNLVSENSGIGIQVHVGGLIQGNTVFNNGGHGIYVGSSNLVVDNAMRGNTGFGLFFFGGSQSNYHGNMMSVNTAGGVGGAGTGLSTGLNSCGNSTTCP
jgi:hypothetical protein